MKTLRQLRAAIKAERRYVDIRKYSHNIISLTLAQIAREYGDDEADKTIRDLKLDKLGWIPQKSG